MLPSKFEEFEFIRIKEEIKALKIAEIKLDNRIFESTIELLDYFYRMNKNEKPCAYRLVEKDRILKEINQKVSWL